MTQRRKPVPKTQVELSQETITPYLNNGKAPVPVNKRRENQRSVKNDDVKQFQVGLKDVDEAIFYYFNNVIRPSVLQNGTKINVPVLYGSPERWAAVQKDGYYRDNNGKIQTPLIMIKRDSVDKNRTLGNKMDANNPIHFGVFEKKYSKKNFYDNFAALNNREAVRQFYGVIMPDYIDIVYSCTIFTEYVEQMNKIVESINYASDSYWGDPERFKFRASIDNYTTVTELIQGGDRTVKTSFQIKMAGYVVSDAINTSVGNPNKFFSKAAVFFNMETAGSTEVLSAKASTPAKASSYRFFDTPPGGNTNITITGGGGGGMTAAEISFVGLNTTAIADLVSSPVATFNTHTIVTPPTGFPAITQNDFKVFINGQFISNNLRTVVQSGSNITVTFSGLEFPVDGNDQVVLVGKFS
jgi:hypothetical protein